jgi:hypothetical protein
MTDADLNPIRANMCNTLKNQVTPALKSVSLLVLI